MASRRTFARRPYLIFGVLGFLCGPSIAEPPDQTFSFGYSGGGVLVFGTIQVSGTPSHYAITGITGTVFGMPQAKDNGKITGLVGAGAFGSNDNQFAYPSPPYLNRNGITFQVGAAQENLYNNGTNYVLLTTNSGSQPFGALVIAPSAR